MKTHWLTTYTYTCSFCRCCRLYCWPLKVYAPLYLKGIITRWELGWRSGRLPLGARTEQKTWFYLKRPLVAGITLHFYVALNQRLETVNCWKCNFDNYVKDTGSTFSSWVHIMGQWSKWTNVPKWSIKHLSRSYYTAPTLVPISGLWSPWGLKLVFWSPFGPHFFSKSPFSPFSA